jgi:hypothetical protein
MQNSVKPIPMPLGYGCLLVSEFRLDAFDREFQTRESRDEGELYFSIDSMGLDVACVFHAVSDRLHIGRSRLTRGGV